MFGLFKKKGCTHGMTIQQKNNFFRRLAKFRNTDEDFFKQQYWDLQPYERDEFGEWVKKDIEQLKKMKVLADMISRLSK